jgi:hypothetical protein
MEEDSGVRQVRGCQIILTHKGRNTHYKVGLGREEIFSAQLYIDCFADSDICRGYALPPNRMASS